MFTGVIKLAQIDDYINPSQSCIKPQIMKPDAELKKATVSLNDCLACSGCITSAQSILVQQMSLEKLISKIQMKEIQQSQPVYIFISPQSILSLSHKFEINCQDLMEMIQRLLRMCYPIIKGVLDMRVAIEISHQLIWQQYLQTNQNKTILCSECPGWVCYAEKTLNQDITSLMSKVKSPQQILGNMIKTITKQFGKDTKCYVAGVMPCYDKKLQAIRFNFEDSKQVDLTITTGEFHILIEQTLKKHNIIFNKYATQSQLIDKQIYGKCSLISKLKNQTSNGYIHSILAKLEVNFEINEVKNSDFIEYRFVKDGKERKMAKCYGFRNIQKIVQLIKRNKCPYEYVEIMACPGGCFGGGGQLKNQNLKVKQLISQLNIISKKYVGQVKLELDEALEKIVKKNDMKTEYKALQKGLQTNINNW